MHMRTCIYGRYAPGTKILNLYHIYRDVVLALPPKGGMKIIHLQGAKEIEPCKGVNSFIVLLPW